MRLYTYVKVYGGYTKSEANSLYNKECIKVNNEIKNFSYIIRPSDIVTIKGKIILPVEHKYYIYNKPVGLICTHDNNIDNIYKHIPLENKISSVGRLDKESSGLLILTNDGKFNHFVLSSNTHIEKEYEVKLKYKINEQFLDSIVKSYTLREKPTIPFKIKSYSDYSINLILYEGKYHEIRRVVIKSLNRVESLKRIRIGNIYLGDLEEGCIKEIPNMKEII